MTDPRRWIEDPSELDDAEIHALSAARDARPPDHLRDQVWTALGAKLPMGGDSGAPPTPSTDGGAPFAGDMGASATGLAGESGATHASTVLGVLKTMAIGAGIGATLTLGVSFLTNGFSSHPRTSASSQALPSEAPPVDAIARSEAIPRAATSLPALPPAPEPARPAYAASPAQLGARTAEVAPVSPASPPGAPTPSVAAFSLPTEPSAPAAAERSQADVHAESRIVAAARDALRAGDVAKALHLLEQARARFPAGVLTQEREALSIEALVRSGQTAAARQRGEQFLRVFAASPHAARVRAALERLK